MSGNEVGTTALLDGLATLLKLQPGADLPSLQAAESEVNRLTDELNIPGA
jgi:hypothetical protein